MAIRRVPTPPVAARREKLDEEDLISRYTTAWNRSPEMVDLHRGQRIDEKV